MTVRTIFTMAEDCGRGERLGWHEFVRDYTPITRVLLEQYFPMLKPKWTPTSRLSLSGPGRQ